MADMMRCIDYWKLLAVAVLISLPACKTYPGITMTCQFNFHDGKGGCSFINNSTMEGKGCVQVEVYHVTGKEVIDSTVLCAHHVPPMQSVTRPLTFEKKTKKACKPAVVKEGKKKETIEKCLLRLSEVKM